MRLAVGQAVSTHDLGENVAAAVALVEEAAAADARLLLLSELFLNGYDIPYLDTVAGPIDPDDAALDSLRNACAVTGISAIIGAATAPGPGRRKPENSLLWFGADASTRIVYTKVHLWAGERAAFDPGDRGALVEFEGITLGLGICYDAGFPEFSRAYAMADVDAILFASAFAIGDERSRYHIYHPARSLESGAFVAVSNALGTLGDSDFFGESAIYNPYGARIANAADRTGIVVSEIDRSATTRARESLQYLRDIKTSYLPRTIDEELT